MSTTPKRVVLIQKWFHAGIIWNLISSKFYGQDYQLVTIPLRKSPGTERTDDPAHVLHILNELEWDHAVFVAHAADCVIANAIALREPERVAGLFFVDLLPGAEPLVLEHSVPTLVVTSAGDPSSEERQMQQRIAASLPGGELFLLEQNSSAALSEVFHAFCEMRV